MRKESVLSLSAPNPNGESIANPNPNLNNNHNPNPNPMPNPNPKPDLSSAWVASSVTDDGSTAMSIDGVEEDDALAVAEFLSREEVLRRRSRRLKQLNRCYRRQYWALMEVIRAKHRDYYWEFGKSPVEEENVVTTPGMVVGQPGLGQADGENGSSSRGERKRCAYTGCKSKEMPLTSYCHAHILSDTKQTLYKACNSILKSTNNVSQICAKPILRAADPSLCPNHYHQAQKKLSQVMKKAGVNIYSSNKSVTNLNAIISECVRQIQDKRRKKMSGKANTENSTEKDENSTEC